LIAIGYVAVVTGFVTVFACDQIGPQDTVAAFGYGAVVSTGIGINIVTIITGFIPFLAFSQVGSPNPIAATGGLAIIVAPIIGVDVPIIAEFVALDGTVTASAFITARRTFIAYFTIVDFRKVWSNALAVLFDKAGWMSGLECIEARCQVGAEYDAE